MVSVADTVFDGWSGMIDNDLPLTIRKTFNISEQDDYQYAAGTYQVTLAQVQESILNGHYKWVYWSPEKTKIPVSTLSTSENFC
jgi:hypothetical protein